MKYFFFSSFFVIAAVFAAGFLAPMMVHAQALPPIANPPAGEQRHGIRVSLTSETVGLFGIKYTTDGSNPGCPPTPAGTTYTTPIRLITDTVVKAITCASGLASTVQTFEYTFRDGSNPGGGPTSNSTEVPYGPACETDPTVCPPGTPGDADANSPLLPPVFGNVLANDISSFTRDLTLGMNGSDVVVLQWFLITQHAGPASERLRSVGATGLFGPMTRDAVIEFQKRTGVSPASGYVGTQTRARINGLKGALPNGMMTAPVGTIVTPSPTLIPPMSGQAVSSPDAPAGGSAAL